MPVPIFTLQPLLNRKPVHQPAAAEAADARKGLLFHSYGAVGGPFCSAISSLFHFLSDILTMGRKGWCLTEGCPGRSFLGAGVWMGRREGQGVTEGNSIVSM